MNISRYSACAILILLVLTFWNSQAEAGGGRKKPKSGNNGPRGGDIFLTDIPAYPGNVIAGRPSDHSIVLSVMMNENADVQIIYGLDGKLSSKKGSYKLASGTPAEIVLNNLLSDKLYQYRVVDSKTGKSLLPPDKNGSFHTQRNKGEDFIFTVTADSHLDGSCLPEAYKATLDNIIKAHPDFHIDLGDTFMTGKHANRASADKQYIAQRYYFGLIGSTSPLFLVLGNHDGEEALKQRGQDSESLAVWSCEQRKKYFPNPVPDSFYTGNSYKNPDAGLLEDYYSWTWGNALFVVLDPYWYSGSGQDRDNPWNMTIGKTQYDWFSSTLRKSNAKYKFVFIHQLVGGYDKNGRGGVEVSNLYEWGGYDPDGKNTFTTNRPGWGKPIHDLLVETHVTAVFHGHDHFYARQQRDGIIYQLVPQPSHQSNSTDHAAEYGYKSGDIQSGSGFIKVSVTASGVKLDYVRS
jgi:hypothetical protein